MGGKSEKGADLDIFVQRVLRSVKEGRLTSVEVCKSYCLLFPQGYIAKIFIPQISPSKIETALHELCELGFVHKEITRYTDKPLKKDTAVYSLSQSGRSFLNPKRRQ